MNTSGALKPIEFHGDTLYVTEINDRVHVILKPAFDAIGVDADRQIKNIQAQPWSCTAVTAVQVGGQLRNMVTADVRSFLMALATIDLDVIDIRRALKDGGVLRLTGAPKKAYRAWFWFTGSAWTIHPHVLPELTRKVVETRKVLGAAASIQMELALDAEFTDTKAVER